MLAPKKNGYGEGEFTCETQRRERTEKRRDELQQEVIALGRGHEERMQQQHERHQKEIEAERGRMERLKARLDARFEAQSARIEALQDERQLLRDRVRQLEAELPSTPQRPLVEEVR